MLKLVFLGVCVLLTSAAPYNPSRKAEALFRVINRPTAQLAEMLKDDQELRGGFQKAMSVIVDFTMTPKERKAALQTVMEVKNEEMTKQIEIVIPLYESIRALIVETFFPRNPELGARFFEEALFLIVDDGYIEATTEDRRLQLESLISKYVL